VGDQNGAAIAAVDTRTERQRQHDERMAKRATRLAGEQVKAADLEIDVMAALDDAEQEYGTSRVKRIDLSPGVCSVIVALTPACEMPIKHLRNVQRSQSAKASDKMKVGEGVARAGLIWPANSFDRITKDYPAAAETIANEVLVLAGAKAEDDAGK
jgi:hypothetical protein